LLQAVHFSCVPANINDAFVGALVSALSDGSFFAAVPHTIKNVSAQKPHNVSYCKCAPPIQMFSLPV